MMTRPITRAVTTFAAVAMLAAILMAPDPVHADGSWEAIGPTGGFAWSLAASPAFAADGTVFAGTDGRGVLKSIDKGSTWRRVGSKTLGRVIAAMVVSPTFETDDTVFAGGPSGVYRSTDGGGRWVQVNEGLDNPKVVALAMSPDFAEDSTLFAGTTDGVYKSTDGGGSWSVADTGLTGGTVLSLGISPGFQSDSTILAGLLGKRRGQSFGGGDFTTPDGGLFRSTDGGSTWAEVNEGFREISPVAISFSPNFGLDSTAFLGTLHNGILRSSDGGSTWAKVNEGLAFERFPAVEFSPAFQTDSTVFAGTYGVIFRSMDGGDSWEQLNEERSIADSRVQGLAVSPAYATDSTLFAGAGTGGILRSTDGGDSWQQLTKGFAAVTNVRSVAVTPDFASDSTLFFSTSEGGVTRSPDAGGTWQEITKGLAAGAEQDWLLPDVWTITVSPDYAADSTVLLGTSRGVFRTNDGGEEWERLDVGGLDAGGTEWPFPAVAFSPDYAADSAVFVGGGWASSGRTMAATPGRAPLGSRAGRCGSSRRRQNSRPTAPCSRRRSRTASSSPSTADSPGRLSTTGWTGSAFRPSKYHPLSATTPPCSPAPRPASSSPQTGAGRGPVCERASETGRPSSALAHILQLRHRQDPVRRNRRRRSIALSGRRRVLAARQPRSADPGNLVAGLAGQLRGDFPDLRRHGQVRAVQSSCPRGRPLLRTRAARGSPRPVHAGRLAPHGSLGGRGRAPVLRLPVGTPVSRASPGTAAPGNAPGGVRPWLRATARSPQAATPESSTCPLRPRLGSPAVGARLNAAGYAFRMAASRQPANQPPLANVLSGKCASESYEMR